MFHVIWGGKAMMYYSQYHGINGWAEKTSPDRGFSTFSPAGDSAQSVTGLARTSSQKEWHLAERVVLAPASFALASK